MSQTPYEVTARKYRPRTFADVVEQDHVTRTLQNALRTGQIHHAYLFTGPRGTGKTTTARLLAKALNCQAADEMTADPCGECEACTAIARGNSVDVKEIDGASNNSVDQIRELRETIGYAAMEGRYKVYVIDEVHMLSNAAFNALLKTLEEPPRHVVFVFATTEPGKVLPTILSRVQRYDFRRIGVAAITDTLREICEKEGIQAEEEALNLMARKADGALRDAESLLDQVRAFAGTEITLEATRDVLGAVDTDHLFTLTRACAEGDAAAALSLAARLADEGQDPREFMLGYGEHLRHLVAASVAGEAGLETLPGSERDRYLETRDLFELEDYLRRLEYVIDAAHQLRESTQPWIALESVFIRLVLMDRSVDLRELLGKIDRELEGVGSSAKGGSDGGGEELPGADVPPEPREAPSKEDDTQGRLLRDRGPEPPPEVYEADGEYEQAQEGGEEKRGNGSGRDFEVLKAHWKSILEEIHKRKVTLAVFLGEGELQEIRDDQIILAFRGENHNFHINTVLRHTDLIREVTRDIVGHGYGVHCEKAPPRPGGGDHGSREMNEELLERLTAKDEDLRKIVEMFDARLEDGPGGRPGA
ncbi:MAG: DNA polymerase III subunit gamma/tau [bacterium]